MLSTAIKITGRDGKGLKFSDDGTSYIEYQPDMRPFTEAMSVCSWIKKLRSAQNTIWFGYCMGGEIVISDSGGYNNWWSNSAHWYGLSGAVPIIGEWYHLCSTWSRSLDTVTIYKDGNLLKTSSKGSTGLPIPLNGFLVIGDDCNGDNGNNGAAGGYPFGGEMAKLNVFSKDLSAAEIKAMSDSGIGSNIEETYGEQRHIRWEDILLKPRTGNVAEKEVDATVLGNKTQPKNKQLNIVTLNPTLIPTQTFASLRNPKPNPNSNNNLCS